MSKRLTTGDTTDRQISAAYERAFTGSNRTGATWAAFRAGWIAATPPMTVEKWPSLDALKLEDKPVNHEASRVETGVIRFENDWPGVFIRGDDAIGFAAALRRHLNGVATQGDILRLRELAKLLDSARVDAGRRSANGVGKVPRG